jgi:phosphoribosylaminoimidazole carboxylase (NCAIR synthetase)
MNLTLTLAQVETITAPAIKQFKDRMAIEANGHAIKVKRLESKHRRKLDAANVRTADWKARYQMTRKNLLVAMTEIQQLKRRLRDGKWEE